MNLPRIARVECDGFDYSVFATGDFLSQQVFRNGTWGKLQHALSGILLKGFEVPVVVDVGANFGLYTVPVASMVAPSGGRVLAFEPQRIVFQQLCTNVFSNRLDCVWAFNQAVGAETGTIDIPSFDYSKTANIGAFSLDEQLQKMRGLEAGVDRDRAEPVPMTMLDSLAVGGKVRVVKIDVEGMEIDVIRGGRKFLESHGFPPLIFEAWEGEWFTDRRKELFAEVERLGYAISRLARDEFFAQHPNYEASVTVQVDGNRVNLSRSR
jgi:FkbM family methyltransferase